jgi:hypothetical protein
LGKRNTKCWLSCLGPLVCMLPKTTPIENRKTAQIASLTLSLFTSLREFYLNLFNKNLLFMISDMRVKYDNNVVVHCLPIKRRYQIYVHTTRFCITIVKYALSRKIEKPNPCKNSKHILASMIYFLIKLCVTDFDWNDRK